MEFKTEVEMQSEFIEFLKKQGYPSDTIETERHISSKTAKFNSRLDVAIVVGGKIIQAFELKKDSKTKNIKHTLHQGGVQPIVGLRSATSTLGRILLDIDHRCKW